MSLGKKAPEEGATKCVQWFTKAFLNATNPRNLIQDFGNSIRELKLRREARSELRRSKVCRKIRHDFKRLNLVLYCYNNINREVRVSKMRRMDRRSISNVLIG